MQRKEDVGRTVFAVMLLAGSVANFVLSRVDSALYRGFADLSIVPVYRQLWGAFIYPHLSVMINGVILFEAVVALLLLSKGRWVTLGAFGGCVFMVALIPFWWSGGALLNLVFAVMLCWIGVAKYPATIPEVWSRRRRYTENVRYP